MSPEAAPEAHDLPFPLVVPDMPGIGRTNKKRERTDRAHAALLLALAQPSGAAEPEHAQGGAVTWVGEVPSRAELKAERLLQELRHKERRKGQRARGTCNALVLAAVYAQHMSAVTPRALMMSRLDETVDALRARRQAISLAVYRHGTGGPSMRAFQDALRVAPREHLRAASRNMAMTSTRQTRQAHGAGFGYRCIHFRNDIGAYAWWKEAGPERDTVLNLAQLGWAAVEEAAPEEAAELWVLVGVAGLRANGLVIEGTGFSTGWVGEGESNRHTDKHVVGLDLLGYAGVGDGALRWTEQRFAGVRAAPTRQVATAPGTVVILGPEWAPSYNHDSVVPGGGESRYCLSLWVDENLIAGLWQKPELLKI